MKSLPQEFTGKSFYVPNGPMDCKVRLAIALRYFAGGSYLKNFNVSWSWKDRFL